MTPVPGPAAYVRASGGSVLGPVVAMAAGVGRPPRWWLRAATIAVLLVVVALPR